MPHARRHENGFWVIAAAFLVTMGFSAVPTPLYALYERRDHFSTLTVTVVYAVYAVGVVGALFLGGHVSDWVGRKRVLVCALLLSVASAVVFLLFPALPGLIGARIVNGVSVGLTTATATAYLAELNQRSARRGQVVATAANLGGIGVGPLLSGFLAQWAPYPLRLPYLAFGAALLVLAVLVAASPETAPRPDVMPRWRPQRIAVPAQARATFFSATAAGVAAFAVYGVFNSLAPGFLAGTLHERSHAVAGAVAFAAFASGALAQIAFLRLDTTRTLRLSFPTLVVGLALLTGGMWVPDLALFVVGGVVTGAGGGLVFRGAMMTAAATAPSGSRAEVLAGFFLGAYVGLSVPVIGLGVATTYAPARDVMLVFVVIAVAAIALSLRAVLRTPAVDPR
ncbi:MFS transporter [Acidothermaceae bacterium B102]|nr:MFS transporter [Acidothermaceae bacterium B102]